MQEEENFARSQGVIAVRPFHDLITKAQGKKMWQENATNKAEEDSFLALPSEQHEEQTPARRGGASKR